MVDTSIVIALAGNPNSGKTSIFNFITGSHQHVGNYPGVTVEKKEGTVPVDNTLVKFVDLPGTYSLGPFTLEEYIACREIISNRISGVIGILSPPIIQPLLQNLLHENHQNNFLLFCLLNYLEPEQLQHNQGYQ